MAAAQLVLVALMVLVSAVSAGENVTVALDPLQLEVRGSANCCPVDGEEGPCNQLDCPASTGLLDTADWDALTEWTVDFVSETSETAPRAEISFNLGQVQNYCDSMISLFIIIFASLQVYRIASVTLLSTTQLLPRNWSLILSSNGTASQSFDLSNGGLYEVSTGKEGWENECINFILFLLAKFLSHGWR